MKRRALAITAVPVTLAVMAGAAYADAGVPMIVIMFPGFAVSLLPIVLVEGYVLRRRLELPLGRMLKVSAYTNLFSTVIGIPLTWVPLVAVQLLLGGDRAYGVGDILGKLYAVTIQAPWLIPYEGELGWMMPLAALFLLVPFFYVSWYMEYFLGRRLIREVPRGQVRLGFLRANLISYGLLSAALLGILAYGLVCR